MRTVRVLPPVRPLQCLRRKESIAMLSRMKERSRERSQLRSSPAATFRRPHDKACARTMRIMDAAGTDPYVGESSACCVVEEAVTWTW